MKNICASSNLNCPVADKFVPIKVAVNFNGKLRTYCCWQCADDDIQEASEGSDNIKKAVQEKDVFILTERA